MNPFKLIKVICNILTLNWANLIMKDIARDNFCLLLPEFCYKICQYVMNNNVLKANVCNQQSFGLNQTFIITALLHVMKPFKISHCNKIQFVSAIKQRSSCVMFSCRRKCKPKSELHLTRKIDIFIKYPWQNALYTLFLFWHGLKVMKCDKLLQISLSNKSFKCLTYSFWRFHYSRRCVFKTIFKFIFMPWQNLQNLLLWIFSPNN